MAIDDILAYASGYENGKAMKALPIVEKEILKLPRAYIANVCHTIIGEPFQRWANKKIDERNEKVIKDKDMTINMDESIAQIFKASTAVSGKY